MKNKISLVIVIAVFAVVSLIGFNISSVGQSQNQNKKDKVKVKKILQKDKNKDKFKDEPTLIQEGVISAKQKKHGKIFKGYKGRAKLRDLMTKQDEVEVREEVGDVLLPSGSFDLNTYLHELSCKADAIVVGVINSKASQLNEDGTFLFTDYELIVEDILKDNIMSSIHPSSRITITRTGGAIKLNGKVARAIDYRQMSLEKGEHYLLFLRFLPETGAYGSLDSSRDEDSFQIINSELVRQVSAVPLPFGTKKLMDASIFINNVRSVASNVCINNGGVE